MRNVIIRRYSGFSGRDNDLIVYATDPDGDITISGKPCRILGSLSDGQTAAFAIGENEVTLYLAEQDPQQLQGWEFCTIPPGNSDVFLSGKRRFSPKYGHPFHFDGNKSIPAKRWLIALIVGLCIFIPAFAIGLIAGSIQIAHSFHTYRIAPQTFSSDGMQITLTNEFEQVDVSSQGFTTGFTSSDTSIFVLKEPFTLQEGFGDLTLTEYAQLVIDNNAHLAGGTPTVENGLTIFEYETISPIDGENYSYLIVFFRGPDAFWMFEFSTPVSNAPFMRQTYLDYASSIIFAGTSI